MNDTRPKILCVDDERNVLEGIKLHLRKLGQVLTAESGEEALEVLNQHPDVAVIVSDMRMPEMDGAAFLAEARIRTPDAVRLLLTGYAEVEAAVRAVNEGALFRFLTKPCPPDQLQPAINAALEQHRLLTAEKTLLQKTLMGAVRALVEVLALANPLALGRALRVRDRVRRAARELGQPGAWQAEFAAVFSQLGAVTLPEDVLNSLYDGKPLSREEQVAVAKNTLMVIQILNNIPRLEGVTEILRQLGGDLQDKEVPVSGYTRLLAAVIEIDRLEAGGYTIQRSLEALKERESVFGADVLQALQRALDKSDADLEIIDVAPTALEDGMILAEDVRTTDGLLIAPRGFEVQSAVRTHIRGFQHSLENDTVKVAAPTTAKRAQLAL